MTDAVATVCARKTPGNYLACRR